MKNKAIKIVGAGVFLMMMLISVIPAYAVCADDIPPIEVGPDINSEGWYGGYKDTSQDHGRGWDYFWGILEVIVTFLDGLS